MKKEDFAEIFGDINENYIADARAYHKAKKTLWLKWGAMVACLCLLIGLALPMIIHRSVDIPNDTIDSGDGPSSIVVNGANYLISPHLAITDELPNGFIQSGEADVGDFEDCPYFTNPDTPEWIYVYHEVLTDGTIDSTGTLNRTDTHHAYVRYVDERLRGKDLICYNDEYYISMWSATTYGDNPDVNSEYYNAVKNSHGIRVEGNVPEGFVYAGITEFSGYDTIPYGTLTSNEGTYEVYINPSDPNVIYVSTSRYTSTDTENEETHHKGFNVYIRYACPFKIRY